MSFCLNGFFLGIGSLDFLEFWHGAKNPDEVVLDRFCRKKFFCPKYGFFNLKKNLFVNFQSVCSTMKINIICWVLSQILYLGKIVFMRYRPKCCQIGNEIVGFFNQLYLQNKELK